MDCEGTDMDNAMKYITTLLLLVTIVATGKYTSAQCLSAFQDQRNFFFIVDDGNIIQQEHNLIYNYKAGRNHLAYLSFNNDFKIYHNGLTQTLQTFPPVNYYCTDYIMFVENPGSQYYVLYGEKMDLINKGAGQVYGVGDSLVAFQDYMGQFQLFKDGRVYEIDQREPYMVKVEDNMMVYLDRNNELRTFWQGDLITLEYGNPPQSVQVERNIAAYVDYIGNFKVFWAGDIYNVLNFQPGSYKAGQNLVAYIDNRKQFKIFYKGESFDIMSIEPKWYDVQQNFVVWVDNNNYFNVFYEGKYERLEGFVPASYQISNNLLVYPNLDNYLFGYINGKKVKVSDEVTTWYEVQNDAVNYYKIKNFFKIYCDGKITNAINR